MEVVFVCFFSSSGTYLLYPRFAIRFAQPTRVALLGNDLPPYQTWLRWKMGKDRSLCMGLLVDGFWHSTARFKQSSFEWLFPIFVFTIPAGWRFKSILITSSLGHFCTEGFSMVLSDSGSTLQRAGERVMQLYFQLISVCGVINNINFEEIMTRSLPRQTIAV